MKHMALALMLIATPALGATRTDTTIAFYHGEPDRAGNYIVPDLNWQSVGAVRRDRHSMGMPMDISTRNHCIDILQARNEV